MKFLDPDTESSIRQFLARLPSNLAIEYAILYGSRARGENRPDSDADVALILSERADDWQLAGKMAEIAFYVFLETGIMVQPVPISLKDWIHPDESRRPSFIQNIAHEGIIL